VQARPLQTRVQKEGWESLWVCRGTITSTSASRSWRGLLMFPFLTAQQSAWRYTIVVCSQIPLLVYEARGLVHFSSGLHLLLRPHHFLSAILGAKVSTLVQSSPVQWYSPVITESSYINSYYKSQHIPLHWGSTLAVAVIYTASELHLGSLLAYHLASGETSWVTVLLFLMDVHSSYN